MRFVGAIITRHYGDLPRRYSNPRCLISGPASRRLADAADTFGHGRYDIAVILTEAAIEGRSRTRSTWLPTMTRSLDDVRAMLTAAAQARAAGAYQNI